MSKELNSDKRDKTGLMKRPEQVVAAVPKEAFKAMFYLFAGRPDSKTKLFSRKICIGPEDVDYLNELVVEKLKLHQIDQTITSVTLKFAKKEIIQFGTWAEFQDFNWKIANVTQEITLRWDFMINLDDYRVAQRHTLVVKLSKAPNPRDVLHMLMSQDLDDDDMKSRLGMCVARVDFISHRLADELIDVVAKWNESLPEPTIPGSWFSELDKYDKLIARAVNYSIPIMLTATAFFLAPVFVPTAETQLSPASFVAGLQWLLISGLGVILGIRLSKYLADQCYSAINEYGIFTPFQLTNGDANSIEKYRKKNNSKIRSFIFNGGVALLLNIASSIAVLKMFGK
ncbi:hypothetical protein [Spirochaeta africana]|uniref:Uncharacterized protein n=1 Tax=Spirochaeta africana (strain ATCC 700263 / DSM 8902 / Z-7692) TaxID=889378 RepID=H9UIY0_SPIAZ|nr:hypothetical protein [Spirochaeta africana]AFG37473.1 hypothetical protein Spiaf_1410 [Spirochaeta africana DSM 8902]